MDANPTYSFQIVVDKNDIDNLDHTNNITYLEWVLKAADLHWKSLSSDKIATRFL